MTTSASITLDEYLRPQPITCATCGGNATVYPTMDDAPVACAACSPAWLPSFALFRTNQDRVANGLASLNE